MMAVFAQEVGQHFGAPDTHRALFLPAGLGLREHEDDLGAALGVRRAESARMTAPEVRY
jgi:hypothetical protein